MGKKLEQFKSFPVWLRIAVVAVAVMIGGCVYLVASGVSDSAKKQTAVDGCNRALAEKGGAAIGSPYVSDYPGGWGVTGQALVGGQQVAFDCSTDHDGNGAEVDLLP